MPAVSETNPVPLASLATAPGTELVPGTDVGGYVIESKIGEGGMGVVYGARQPRIGKRVAIKVLSPTYSGDAAVVHQFEQEARVVNEIRHPNIVDVFQFGELPDKRSYFVMEWLDGEPLTARIDRGPLGVYEAVQILDAIADALEAAHEQQVVHRDLKSDNIFLVVSRGRRTVKLLDFGLATLSGSGALETAPLGSTKSGIVVGTPAYMSPEQARGQDVDGRTDIYALGILAYKMLTGSLPFRGDNAMDIIAQQLNAPPPHPSKLAPKTPAVLSRLVVQMMAKDMAQRPSLDEIRGILGDLIAELAPPRARSSTQMPKLASASSSLPVIAEGPVGGIVRSPSQIEADSAPSLANVPATPAPSRRTTGMLVGVAAALVAVIVGAGVLMKKRAPASPPSAAATAPAAAVAPVATQTPAPVAAPAPAEQPTIEFDPDPVHRAQPAVAHHAAVAATPAAPVTSPTADAPDPDVASRPAAVLISLEHASTIEIDDKVVATGLGGRFEVTPGHHEVHIQAADRQLVSRPIDVDAGGSVVIKIADDVAAPAAATPEPSAAPPAAAPALTPPPVQSLESPTSAP